MTSLTDINAAGVQVKGIFLDYDGTVAPLDVPKSCSTIEKRKLLALKGISAKIPVAVISTKDLAFLVKRTPFAHGWSAIGGLETRIGNTTVSTKYTQEQVFQVNKALECVKSSVAGTGEVTVEQKQDSNGSAVAFSVDWRQAKNPLEAEHQAAKLFAYCKALPLTVVEYNGQPFFDVFPCPIDKGKALLELKERFGLRDGVMYLGDSAVDNAAFRVADIAVGVVSEGKAEDLACDYFLNFADLAIFLEDLLRHSFYFCTNLSKIRVKH